MKINNKLWYLTFLMPFLFFTNLIAQEKDIDNQALPNGLPQKEASNFSPTKTVADNEQTAYLSEWLTSPYLNVPVEKATVLDLTLAFEQWLKAHPEATKGRYKDNDIVKYQRKLYKMQMDYEFGEIPSNTYAQLDAYTAYDKANPYVPVNNFTNPDANWRLLGPTTDPIEANYSEPAYSAEKSADNTGLGRINCIEFSNWDTKNIWIGTSTGGVWKTYNGGQSWINISMNLPIMEISDIAIDQSNSNIIYLATGDRDGRGGWYGNGVNSRLFKTTDGGTTWFPIEANFGTGVFIMNLWVHPQRPWEVVVVKTNGVYKSTDGGGTWSQVLTTNYTVPFAPPNDLLFRGAAYADLSNPERIYAIHSKRYTATNLAFQLRRSDDFGKTWQLMDSIKAIFNGSRFPTNFIRMGVAPSDANCLYIVASEVDTVSRQDRFGGIIRTLDGGKTWENRSRYPSVPNILGWVLGDSSDVGSQSFYDLVLTIDPKNKEKISVGGVDSWVSNDGGRKFDKSTFWLNALGESAHADHHWGEYQPISGDYFLATDGGLYKTSNLLAGDNALIKKCYSDSAYNIFNQNCYTFPTKWSFVGNGISNNDFYAIAVSKSNPSIVMAGAQDNGTLIRRNGKWYSVFGGDGFVPMIHPSNPDIFYTTVYYGQTWRTHDGGKTYQKITTAIDTLDLGDWLTQMEMYEANPNIIVQARQKYLWRTTNGGDTWQNISKYPIGKIFNRTTALAIAPSNPNIIIAAKLARDTPTIPTSFSLYHTLDAGNSWKNIWSPTFPNAVMTDIAIHPTQPNKIWVTFSVGYLATNVNQSRKVFYSENNGSTWTNITEGLPLVPVRSIAIQENSPIDAVYVATGVGVFYKDKNMSKFVEFQVGMPRGVLVTDVKIHSGIGKVFVGTYGRGVWSANLYDQPYDDDVTALKANRSLLLNVYPNPARDAVRIEWDNIATEGQTLDIVDMFGRTVFSQKEFKGKANFDMTQQASGVYTVQLKTGKEVVSKKFILAK